MQKIKDQVDDGSINANNCHAIFTKQLSQLKEERLQEMSIQQKVEISKKVMQLTWQTRLALHKNLNTLSSCRTDLRKLFFRLRSIEDLAALQVYPEKQTSVPELGDMQKGLIPLVDNDYFHGYLGKNGEIENGPVDFQSGDIMLTRGGSFFSAILSTITDHPNQLDHFVLVNKTAAGELHTIESYAQTGGVSAFDMSYALKNENPRIVVIRPKDSALGKKASDIMYDAAVLGDHDKSRQIKYDYHMSFNDEKKMTCTAVTYWGYKKASNGRFLIPEERSSFSPKLKQVFEMTGMSSAPILSAQDAELDSRFDLVLEFRDYRLLEDSRFREAAAISFFKWMREDGYRVSPTLNSLAIDTVIYPLRRTKLWPAVSKLTGANFPEDAPKGFVKTLSIMNDINDVLYKHIYEENKKFKASSGWSMTQDQMLASLEKYRQADLEKCTKYSAPAPDFHFMFSPKTCKENPMVNQ